jgi:gluconate transporter
MPSHGTVLILLTAAAIATMLLLILVAKLHAFLALIITSMGLGLAAGMPPDKVLKSIESGFGGALGFIAVVVGLGAMIGRFIEHSGGGRALADWLLLKFGKDRAAWAILIAAFLVGLPLFFEVGFMVMIPLVWNLARETKRSLLFYGIPMVAALTMVHSLVPPHPAPAAASALFGADLGHTILYGVATALPMAIFGGIVYGGFVARRIYLPVPEIASAQRSKAEGEAAPPPLPVVVMLLVLPVILIFGATAATLWHVPGQSAAIFLGHPFTALAITAVLTIYLFGIRRGIPRPQAGRMAAESLAPMGALLCIMGGGGAFKQIIVDSGAGAYLGKLLLTSAISPLVVIWLIAACMRLAQGSATVSIITAAGIVAPMVKGLPGYSPSILVLALCTGGCGFSHVTDSGFWIVNQYFGLTVPQTFKCWTAMKVLGSLVGLGIVLAAHALLP